MALALLVLWAALFLPNLRTNPNWYGDEGEWMEKCWTFIHGHPRVGPITNDFLYPYPYPPLYMLVNGTLLTVFGNDIVVGRALGAVTALVAGALLFWVGTRLKNTHFGFLCAAVFLVYPETVMNFRWVRPHPMTGTIGLASVGFLLRYVQEKRFRDIVWAGLFCSLALGTNYFAYGLLAAVVLTAMCVNWRHTFVAAVTAGAYGILFCLWYVLAHPGGTDQFLAQLHRLTSLETANASPSLWGAIVTWYRNAASFLLLTPTMGADGTQLVDVWLIVAIIGVFLFPFGRYRKWLILWLLGLMLAVFKQISNASIFFYPATVFLPLLAVGFAGALWRLQGWLAHAAMIGRQTWVQTLPTVVAVGAFGLMSLSGAWEHFRSKVDPWTVHSVADAEAVLRFVNQRTTPDDFVIVPKHVYWLVKPARKSMLTHCVSYEGKTDGVFPALVPQELYWFDCRWQNAKYIVLAYGRDVTGRPFGFDAVYSLGFPGIRRIVEAVETEKWPQAFQNAEFIVFANPRLVK